MRFLLRLFCLRFLLLLLLLILLTLTLFVVISILIILLLVAVLTHFLITPLLTLLVLIVLVVIITVSIVFRVCHRVVISSSGIIALLRAGFVTLTECAFESQGRFPIDIGRSFNGTFGVRVLNCLQTRSNVEIANSRLQ